MVSGICWGGRSSVGTMVRSLMVLITGAVQVHDRIVNAEMRQPKSDRGEFCPANKDFFDALFLTDRQEFNANLASTLVKALNVMLTHTSSERGRTAVPLITNATGISPFPIKITVKVGGIELGY